MSTLLELMKTAFESKVNEERTKAEQTLLLKSSEDIEFFKSIAAAAEDGEYCEQASLLLNSATSAIWANRVNFKEQHTSILTKVISSDKTSLKIKGHIVKGLVLLVKNSNESRMHVEDQLTESLNSNRLLIALVYFQILSDALDLNGYGQLRKTEIKLGWINMTIEAIGKLVSAFDEHISEGELTQVRQFADVFANFCYQLFTVKAEKKDAFKYLQDSILHNKCLTELLFKLLMMKVVQEGQIQNNFISSTHSTEINAVLNEIKSNILKIYQHLIYEINSRSTPQARKCKINDQLLELIPMIIYSLLTYVNAYNIKDIQSFPYIPTIITTSLKILASCAGNGDLYQIFTEAKISLVTEVVYPFMVTTDIEYSQMKDDPDEFVNLSLDTIDKQLSDLPRTAAATLIEALCDHIDGSISFIGQLTIMIAQYAVKSNSGRLDTLTQQEKEFHQLIHDKKIYTQFTDVQRLEASLTIITVMSYLLQKRPDLIALIEKLLIENIEYFMNTTEDIVQLRLALFFGYYCDNLFKSEGQSPNMISYLQILITYIQPHKQALLYQSIDALKDIFEDEDLKQKTRPLILSVFPPLVQALSFSIYDRHFDMISNLIHHEPQIFLENQQLLADYLSILTTRILFEQDVLNKGIRSAYIHINRSWNAIKSLCDIAELHQVLPAIEHSITPLYHLIQQPTKIDFEEEIILIVIQFIDKLKLVTQNQVFLLPHFQRVLHFQHDRLGSLYEMFNLYISYGTDIFKEEYYQSIYFHLAVQAIISQEDYVMDTDRAEGALLIQLGIQLLGETISQHLLTQLFKVALEQLQSPELKQGYLRSRIVGIFLSALYKIPSITYEILSEIFSEIYNYVLTTKYETGYDTKLFVLTMSQLLKQQQSLFNSQTIQILVNCLTRQREHELEEFKEIEQYSSFEQVEDNLLDDTDEDYESEEDKHQATIQIELLKSPVLLLDEFLYFHDMIFHYKEKSPELIDQLKQDLDEQSMKRLQSIISCVRIETEEGNCISRNIVKISKRKRKEKK